MDRYTKFILILIAVLLALNLLKPLFSPQEGEARKRIADVNIVTVGGIPVKAPLRVYIAGSVFTNFSKDDQVLTKTE